MTNPGRLEQDSVWQRIEDDRLEASDREKYGLGEEHFRQFQEERKRAAQEADEQEHSREFSLDRAGKRPR